MQFDEGPTRNEAPADAIAIEAALFLANNNGNSKSNSNSNGRRNNILLASEFKLSDRQRQRQQHHHDDSGKKKKSPPSGEKKKKQKEKADLLKLVEEGVPLEITVEISPTTSDTKMDGIPAEVELSEPFAEEDISPPPPAAEKTSDNERKEGIEVNLPRPFSGGILPTITVEASSPLGDTKPSKEKIPTPAPEHTDLERPFAQMDDMKVTIEKPPESNSRRNVFKFVKSLSRGRVIQSSRNLKETPKNDPHRSPKLNDEAGHDNKDHQHKNLVASDAGKKPHVLEPVVPPRWISIKTTTPSPSSDGKRGSPDQCTKLATAPLFPPPPLDVDDECLFSKAEAETAVVTVAGTAAETAGAVIADLASHDDPENGRKKSATPPKRNNLPKLSSHRGTDFVPGKKPPQRPSRKETPTPDEYQQQVEDDEAHVAGTVSGNTEEASESLPQENEAEPAMEEKGEGEGEEESNGVVRMLNTQAEMMLARRRMVAKQERQSAYDLYDVMESSVPQSIGREDFSSSMVSSSRRADAYQDPSVTSARSSNPQSAMMMSATDHYDDQGSRRSHHHSEASYSRSQHQDLQHHHHHHRHHRGQGPHGKYIGSPPSLPEGSRGQLSASSLSSDSRRSTPGRGGFPNNRNPLSGYTDLSLVSHQERLARSHSRQQREYRGDRGGRYPDRPQYLGPDYGRYPNERGRGERFVDPRYAPYHSGREPFSPSSFQDDFEYGRRIDHPDLFRQDGYYSSRREIVEDPRYRETYFDGPPPRQGGYYQPDSRYDPPVDRWDEFSVPSYHRDNSFRGGGRIYDEEIVEEGEPVTVEIEPGFNVPLRTTEETVEAVSVDFFKSVVCFSCSEDIFCIADVEYVLCPGCRVISPVEGEEFEGRRIQRHGVGLGFTCESLFKMQGEILAERSGGR